MFAGAAREFVLSDPRLNLWSGIRDAAIEHFGINKILWWPGSYKNPTGHLLSSQVACVNHLFALRDQQDLATLLLQSIDNAVVSAEKVYDGYVEFEFIGWEKQHLKEKGYTRGANCTSVDAAMIGKKKDGTLCLFLFEWKYVETYVQTNKYIPARAKVYDELIMSETSPFRKKSPPVYYYEPFYQLMRQTLLGWMICKNQDRGCTEYHHIHVVPAGNKELSEKVTSPELRAIGGENISEVWKGVLADPDRFTSTTPEELMTPLRGKGNDQLLLNYLSVRYAGGPLG